MIRTGDVIRMGRVIYRVCETSIDKKKKMVEEFEKKAREKNRQRLS